MDKSFHSIYVPGYESLAGILLDAYNQAARTKGAERHANGMPFDKQPMQTVADNRGIGFLLGQADKKSIEAQRMLERGEVSKARHELLGAINYIAGAILFVDRTQTSKQDVGEPIKFDPEAATKAEAMQACTEATEALGKLTAAAMEACRPTFKVGDRVRVINDVAQAMHLCNHSRAGWYGFMALQLGQLGTVVGASEFNTYRVKTLSGDSYWWAADCLEHAPAEQEPEPERQGTAVHMILLDDSDPDVEAIQRMLAGFLNGK